MLPSDRHTIDYTRTLRFVDQHGRELDPSQHKPYINVSSDYNEDFAKRAQKAGVRLNFKQNYSRRDFLNYAGKAAAAYLIAGLYSKKALANPVKEIIVHSTKKHYGWKTTVEKGGLAEKVIMIDKFEETLPSGDKVDLLDLYRYMTGTEGTGKPGDLRNTLLGKFPEYPVKLHLNENDPLAKSQYVNAFRNEVFPRWSDGLKKNNRILTETFDNSIYPSPPLTDYIGAFLTYKDQGTSKPASKVVGLQFDNFQDGTGYVKTFGIEINTAFPTNKAWIDQMKHVFGHFVLCLFREDDRIFSEHIMHSGGMSGVIQPIEFRERDLQINLPLGRDMSKYFS